jgi:hypothetical protein
MRYRALSQAKKPALAGTAEDGLRLYSLAAAAASVSALALLQPAEAEIVITNKTIPIHANSAVFLDLNGDGVKDFEFFLSNYTISQYTVNNLSVLPVARGADAVIGGCDAGACPSYNAAAMLRGAKIGPGGPFIRTYGGYGIPIEESVLCTQNCGQKPGYSFDQFLEGNWGGGHPNRFIGVKFKIKGKIHFGWVRLTVTVKHKGSGHGPTGSFSATITEYGYESVPNKSCGAGLSGPSIPNAVDTSAMPEQGSVRKTGPSLGMLSLGADAMPMWRREETSARQ